MVSCRSALCSTQKCGAANYIFKESIDIRILTVLSPQTSYWLSPLWTYTFLQTPNVSFIIAGKYFVMCSSCPSLLLSDFLFYSVTSPPFQLQHQWLKAHWRCCCSPWHSVSWLLVDCTHEGSLRRGCWSTEKKKNPGTKPLCGCVGSHACGYQSTAKQVRTDCALIRKEYFIS